jgi:hypothetical protein
MKIGMITTWFNYIFSAPSKWRRRTRIERLLLIEAFLLLGLARFLVLTLPFKWLARTIGTHMSESGPDISGSDFRLARLIGQAVRSAANNTPWQSVCLPQAVVGQWMLKRRNIPGTVYLGVAINKTIPDKLSAHAWLRYGSSILTGADGHRQFTVVSTFSTDKH